MRRRSVLSCLGTLAVGGCQQVRTPPFQRVRPRKLVRVAAETKYDVAELSVKASIVQSMITPEKQPRIELTGVWQGTDPTRITGLPSQRYTLPEEPVLWLLSPNRNTQRRNQQTWVVADESTGFQGGQRVTNYDPGEAATQEYDIWANPYRSARIRPGQYELTEEARRSDGWSTPWTLEIEIATVESEP